MRKMLTHVCLLVLQKLVVKPDQLIKRRGKLGLIKVGTDLAGVQSWVDERMNKDQQVRHLIVHLCCLASSVLFGVAITLPVFII